MNGNLSALLKGTRIFLGISQGNLAKKLGIRQATLSRYEARNDKPNREIRDRILKFLAENNLDIRRLIEIGQINWSEEIKRILNELDLSTSKLARYLLRFSDKDIKKWLGGSKIKNSEVLNRLLQVKEMLDKGVDKRKILLFINKKSFLDNEKKLKIYLLRKYYLQLTQKEASEKFKIPVTQIESSHFPISDSKYEKIVHSDEVIYQVEKEIEDKIKNKSFLEIVQYDRAEEYDKIVGFDFKKITKQEIEISNLFRKIAKDVFLHPILASSDLLYKKQSDCYVILNGHDIFIECKNRDLSKSREIKRIISELLTVKEYIKPSFTLLISKNLTKQQRILLNTNGILTLNENEIREFLREGFFKKISESLGKREMTDFVPKTFGELKKWREINYISRRNMVRILNKFKIRTSAIKLYNLENKNPTTKLQENWVNCLKRLNKIKRELGLRELHKIAYDNIISEFESVIYVKHKHPLGKKSEVRVEKFLNKLGYKTYSNVIVMDKNLFFYPRGREIDIIGFKDSHKILASCRTKLGSRQVSREVVDLNFLLNALKEFNKAYLFTRNVKDYVKKKALQLNVEIIDSW